MLDIETTVTLFSLNTLVGKGFHLCQGLHPTSELRVWAYTGENVHQSLSITFPS